MNRAVWYFKQLFPLTYRSHFVEEGKNMFSVWKMWFGRSYKTETVEVKPRG